MSETPDRSLWAASLKGLCPRCGEATLFEAPARIAQSCSHCRLEFTQFERGGRFAGMVTVLTACLLIALAIGVDVALQPPFWLQAAFWAPVTVLTVIGVLRFYKTALLYARFEKRAER